MNCALVFMLLFGTIGIFMYGMSGFILGSVFGFGFGYIGINPIFKAILNKNKQIEAKMVVSKARAIDL